MRHAILKIRNFFRSDEGTSEVEYAVMLMLIVLVCMTAIQAVGDQNKAMYDSIENGVSDIRQAAEDSEVQ